MFSLGGGKKEEKENENLVIEGWDSRKISETLSGFIT